MTVQLTIASSTTPAPQPDTGDPDGLTETDGGEFGPCAGTSTQPAGPGQPGDVGPPLLPTRITFGPGPAPTPGQPRPGGSAPGGTPDPTPQRGTGGGETDGSGNTSEGGGSSTSGPVGQVGTRSARPARRALASRAPRPGRGPKSGPAADLTRRHSRIVRVIAAVRRARTYLTGPSPVRVPAGQLAGLPAPRRPVRVPGRGPASGTAVLGWLSPLLRCWWRTGQGRASRLTDEDWRVIVILAVAAIVAFGAQVDLDAPAPVTVPDAMPAAAVDAGAPSPAPAGGMVDDPTSKGRITATTAHGLAEIRAHFGPVLRGESCWDKHAWNPSSDHPLGKACDVYTSPAGQFASGAGLDSGNQLVAWLRQNAGPLRVAYVIWQGRIWSPEKGDRKYGGGGVYDPTDATGGHFDHIHVSYQN